MTKRRILITLVLVILFAAAVCSFPWPTRVDLTMDAAIVRVDGSIIREGTLEMKGWILNYLYKPDCIQFTRINILGSQVSDQPGHLPTLPRFSYGDSPNYYTIRSSFYLLNERKVISTEIALSKAMDWCCIRIEHVGASSYIVAPGNHDVQSILDQFT